MEKKAKVYVNNYWEQLGFMVKRVVCLYVLVSIKFTQNYMFYYIY